jgi:hypothetical protein
MIKTTNKFSSEVRQRAVRMILDHEGDYPSRQKNFGVRSGVGRREDWLCTIDASRMGEELGWLCWTVPEVRF